MPLEEHMGEVSWESSEKFKESYSQDVSLNRELMTKINKQRDLFCPWAGGVPFWAGGLGHGTQWCWLGCSRTSCRAGAISRRGPPRLPPGEQPPESAGEAAAAAGQTPRVEVFKRSSLIYLRVWQAYLWMFKPDIARRTTSLHP
ncbi:uncharacterized protein LOC131396698 isoform X4 [Diceros bicornis minor]|uniref:uncharacterized protein LOC131396698 isoform X4 n=1 Tax=Diceros bicornis minor TaxID=77932 RepID=UPI0026EF8744|nr:uncharacterized protein LOC131396698 isoform X4 [Diceros bicornis minor]